MSSLERPMKRSTTCASVSSQPSSARISRSMRTASSSLLMSTPSQSKMTSSRGSLTTPKLADGRAAVNVGAVPSLPPFANEPILELRRGAVRGQLGDALATLDRKLPLTVPVIVGGQERRADEFHSTDPGDPDRVVAVAAAATDADLDAAVRAAQSGFRAWSERPAAERASALL